MSFDRPAITLIHVVPSILDMGRAAVTGFRDRPVHVHQ